MQKWEYNVVGLIPPIDLRSLNELGKQGWEAVSWVITQTGAGPGHVEYTILLKRPRS
jgi:hypothetical protein